jgi:hypothetical protein
MADDDDDNSLLEDTMEAGEDGRERLDELSEEDKQNRDKEEGE